MGVKRVLVLKGGGIKGYMQASCLKEVEAGGLDVKGMDLKVGTSVGAINAACLAGGMRAVDLYMMYPKMVEAIFKKVWYSRVPKYDRDNFRGVWLRLMGKRSMGSVGGKLMITSVDRCEDVPHFFKSWEEGDGVEDLGEVVMRSFAAPYYFGQMVDVINRKVWIDGGCGIDNLPLEYALIEVMLLGWLSEEVEIYCFGTGYVRSGESFEEASKTRLLGQVMDFMKPSSGGLAREMSSMEQVGRVRKVCLVFPNIKFRYYDIEIPKEMEGMDRIKCMELYSEYGKRMAEKGAT